MELLCLISIADIAYMKFYPVCELCAAHLLDYISNNAFIKSHPECELCEAPLFYFHYW